MCSSDLGDNGSAAEVWVLRDKREPVYSVEERVSLSGLSNVNMLVFLVILAN